MPIHPQTLMDLAADAGLDIRYDPNADAYDEDQLHFYQNDTLSDTVLVRFAEALQRHLTLTRVEAANVVLRDGYCFHTFTPALCTQPDGRYTLYLDHDSSIDAG